MENETLGNNEIFEEKVNMVDLDNLQVGEDKPMVKPAKVMISKIETREVEFDNNKNTKIVFMVTHPDTKDLLEISKMSYISGDKRKTTGIWLKLDSDGKIPYKSALAELLRFTNKNKVTDLVNMAVDTIADENGYLVLKAY